MKKVAIVNTGISNVDSVARAIEECGGYPVVTSEMKDIETAAFIILPGVGAFPNGMHSLKISGLEDTLKEQVLIKQIPFLGICLGMQMLATIGREGGETNGLGWIDAEVCQLKSSSAEERIPHVGWNEVEITKDNPLFRGIATKSDFYFVHSYHVICRNPSCEVARTPYCGGFTSVLMRENIFGTQFHPEKSQKVGFQLLKNFLSL